MFFYINVENDILTIYEYKVLYIIDVCYLYKRD